MRSYRDVIATALALAFGIVVVEADRGVAQTPPPSKPEAAPAPEAPEWTPVPMRAGKVVLPITGLAIELPKDARKTATWMLSGSWSLGDDGTSFDGRDVIDQKLGDKLVAGNWIHIGYFNAGACEKVVQELDVPDRWTSEADLWGLHFQVAGGTWDFESELGKAPAVALCTATADGQSLLLYHFFLEDRPPTGTAGVDVLAKDRLLERVARAWKAGQSGVAWPTHRPEIRQRGSTPAARRVTLSASKLDVALPDDGFVWLVRTGADGTDFLDRMAPSLPDVTLEVARMVGSTCDTLVPAIAEANGTYDEPAPTGVPLGWRAYPTLQIDTHHERLICRDVNGAALIVGLLGSPSLAPASRDFAPFAPVLSALETAAR
ncbi:MAG TPA: hypothetical protein VHE35_14235 [Kofleriaceae bacterium]|nr:hypothetical protein [Kofleriaceae bacterium]